MYRLSQEKTSIMLYSIGTTNCLETIQKHLMLVSENPPQRSFMPESLRVNVETIIYSKRMHIVRMRMVIVKKYSVPIGIGLAMTGISWAFILAYGVIYDNTYRIPADIAFMVESVFLQILPLCIAMMHVVIIAWVWKRRQKRMEMGIAFLIAVLIHLMVLIKVLLSKHGVGEAIAWMIIMKAYIVSGLLLLITMIISAKLKSKKKEMNADA